MGYKAVVLWSGGIDSTTCLYQLLRDTNCFEVYPIFFDYGQLGCGAECSCINKLCYRIKCHSYFSAKFMGVITSKFCLPGHLLTGGESVAYAKGYGDDLVPGRNTMFAMLGYYHARALKASSVIIASHGGLQVFPDCTPEWVTRMQAIYDLENQTCLDTPEVQIEAPVIHMEKSEIVELAATLQVPIRDTWSCHNPRSTAVSRVFEPCGECPACKIRDRVGLL